MHLPLLVRPNSIIPVGNCDNAIVYDYTKDTVYRIYELEDTAECRIYDENAVEVIYVTACRKENKISIGVTGNATDKPCKIQLVGVNNVKDIKNANAEANKMGVLLISEIGKTVTCEIND